MGYSLPQRSAWARGTHAWRMATQWNLLHSEWDTVHAQPVLQCFSRRRQRAAYYIRRSVRSRHIPAVLRQPKGAARYGWHQPGRRCSHLWSPDFKPVGVLLFQRPEPRQRERSDEGSGSIYLQWPRRGQDFRNPLRQRGSQQRGGTDPESVEYRAVQERQAW